MLFSDNLFCLGIYSHINFRRIYSILRSKCVILVNFYTFKSTTIDLVPIKVQKSVCTRKLQKFSASKCTF